MDENEVLVNFYKTFFLSNRERGFSIVASFQKIRGNRRRSQVAKAVVCKTIIHQFDSDRRLQIQKKGQLERADPFYFLGAGGCRFFLDIKGLFFNKLYILLVFFSLLCVAQTVT